jgi:hypothetical protein
VGITQLVRFLVVELTHSDSNLSVAFTTNYSFSGSSILKGAHRDRVYVRVFIGMNARTCMSICVCFVSIQALALASFDEHVHRRPDGMLR